MFHTLIWEGVLSGQLHTASEDVMGPGERDVLDAMYRLIQRLKAFMLDNQLVFSQNSTVTLEQIQ